jgi:arsenate reductase (thioredoxin)
MMKKVLFLCVGNACRSQMAEGFARTYGKDVIQPYSAGVAPAASVPALTSFVMLEKGIDLATQFPKRIDEVGVSGFDLVVNMSGFDLPWVDPATVREWRIEDPISQPDKVYRRVRDEIEAKVMALILELRKSELTKSRRFDSASKPSRK